MKHTTGKNLLFQYIRILYTYFWEQKQTPETLPVRKKGTLVHNIPLGSIQGLASFPSLCSQTALPDDSVEQNNILYVVFWLYVFNISLSSSLVIHVIYKGSSIVCGTCGKNRKQEKLLKYWPTWLYLETLLMLNEEENYKQGLGNSSLNI